MQVIDVESVDPGLAGQPDLPHEENYENNSFFIKLYSHHAADSFRKTVLLF
jgi:hypothetical protein